MTGSNRVNSEELAVHFSIVLYLRIMNFANILRSKKFWTLISALVAAFAAYFAVSCSSRVVVTRKGVHVDTVSTGVIYRTNNYRD